MFGSLQVFELNQLLQLIYLIVISTLPALSNFTFAFADDGVEVVAVSVTGTKPTLVKSSFALVHALRAKKKPLSFVCARTLYGVSAREILTSEIGAPLFDRTRPVIT